MGAEDKALPSLPPLLPVSTSLGEDSFDCAYYFLLREILHYVCLEGRAHVSPKGCAIPVSGLLAPTAERDRVEICSEEKFTLWRNQTKFPKIRIEVNKTYGVPHWRNDLKRVLKRAGADCKQIVFLLNDQQIKDESFLEDISMVLNTGDVPNLFLPEEKADILERIQVGIDDYIAICYGFSYGFKVRIGMASVIFLQNSTSRGSGGSGGSGDLLGGGEGSFANLYTVFLQNVKRNLHIVLCMSPIGTAFRNRLRMFPSLVNSCTTDWFTQWPDDALEMVAAKSLEDLDLDEDARRACVLMCVHFHQSVGHASDRYLHELGRCNYVTPTSYLALIATFKSLLKGKRDEILSLKTRYEMGLGKLEFASSQVRKYTL